MIALIIIGSIFIFGGFVAFGMGNAMNNDMDMQMESLFNNGTTNPGDGIVYVGVACLVIGLVMLVIGIVGQMNKNKRNLQMRYGYQSQMSYTAAGQDKYCPTCGNRVPMNTNFCASCGFAFQNTSNVAGATQQNFFNNHAGGYNYNAGASKSVGFGEAIQLFFKNYGNFRGRASKSEYWWAVLFYWIIYIALAGVTFVFVPILGLILTTLFMIAFMVPMLSVGVRRLHDIGKSWEYILFGLIPYAGFIILIVYFCKDSDGDNQWGLGPAYSENGE